MMTLPLRLASFGMYFATTLLPLKMYITSVQIVNFFAFLKRNYILDACPHHLIEFSGPGTRLSIEFPLMLMLYVDC